MSFVRIRHQIQMKPGIFHREELSPTIKISLHCLHVWMVSPKSANASYLVSKDHCDSVVVDFGLVNGFLKSPVEFDYVWLRLEISGSLCACVRLAFRVNSED